MLVLKSNFNEYARYYDLFYKDKNYAGEAKDVMHLIDCEIDDLKNILVVGCGTGKHDREFLRLKRVSLMGIDCSSEMIDIAKQQWIEYIKLNTFLGEEKNVEYRVADARSFTVEKNFDCAVSLFHVMSYQRTNEDLKKCFECVNKSLNKDGVFVFDSWYGPGVLRDLPTIRVKTVEDGSYKFLRTAVPNLYPNENAVDVNYHICAIDKETRIVSEIDEIHQMRYWFKNEIEELLDEKGFELIKCLDCNTLDTPTFDSWTVYFVCRKIRNM